jgi:ABC-type nitrate/sulfonate/bicarbonate transport system permease component
VIAAGRALVGLACLAAWQAAHLALGADWISGPIEVGRRAAEIAASGELVRHTVATLTEAALASCWAAAPGS